MTFFQFLRGLWRYASFRMLVIGLASLLASIVEGFSLTLLVPILELVQNSDPSAGRATRILAAAFQMARIPVTITSALLVFFALFVVQSALTRGRDWLVAVSLADFQTRLRDRLYGAVFGANWLFVVNLKRGEIVSVFVLEVERSGRSFHRTMQIAVSAVTALIYLGVALAVSWPFTVVMLVGMALLALSFRGLIGRGGDVGRDTSQANAGYQVVLTEHLDAAKVIRGSGMEALTRAEAQRHALRVTDVERRSLAHTAALRGYLQPVAVGMLCLGIFLAITTLRMDLAAITVILFVFFRMFPMLTLLQQQVYELLLVIPAFARVESLIAEAEAARERNTGPRPPPAKLGTGLRLKDVRYSYVQGRPVLEGVSLDIPSGMMVALVGSSGAGKSTIVDLILRLLTPDAGQVLLDGNPLEQYELAAWRRHVAYVTQETVLLNDTIRANINWGLEQPLSDAALERVAMLANMTAFVDRLPKRYDTVIGDRGALLSGGQRQRIALARALARDPQLLILDEATSALDAESEVQIHEVLQRLRADLTVLLISHRLFTVRHADYIYLLDGGRVVESGQWDDLNALNGRFAQLQTLQAT